MSCVVLNSVSVSGVSYIRVFSQPLFKSGVRVFFDLIV